MSGGIGDGPRTVVLVSGGGTNLQAIIDRVIAGQLGIRLDAVISDRPGVRALDRARQAGVPAITVDYGGHRDRADFDAELADAVLRHEPALVVLAGFMRILDTGLVEACLGRMLNIHPSLLPRYPGLDTYRRALAAGERWHGTTVHFVIPELDAGPGILQYRVAVRPGDDEAGLKTRVQRGEYLIYPRAIAWFAAGRVELRDGATWLDGERRDTPVIVDEES